MSTRKQADTLLIETCIEDGALTLEECAENLAGKAATPEVRALMSMLENAIANAGRGAEMNRGVERDEFCGARRELRAVRNMLLGMVASKTPTK